MIELSGDLRLGQKHFDEVLILRQVGKNSLQDQGLLEALGSGGLGQEHLGHPADGEPANQLVFSKLLHLGWPPLRACDRGPTS